MQEEAKKLDESYELFLTKINQIASEIEHQRSEIIEIERNQSFELLDKIEREHNQLITDIEIIRVQGSSLCAKSEKFSRLIENELQNIYKKYEDLNKNFSLILEKTNLYPCERENLTTTITKTETHTQSKHAHESKYFRSKRVKSPSETSIDSTNETFDTELKQKYMRAVAYLKILDESSCTENNQENEIQYESIEKTASNSAVDIDFVIQQAKQVAAINEINNPDRARRILEKVNKLEVKFIRFIKI